MQNAFHDLQSSEGVTEAMPEGMTNDSMMGKGPFSLERLHRCSKTSPGLNLDALLSPRDDVRLGKTPDNRRGSMTGGPGDHYPPGGSPQLCRASSVMAQPVSRLGGPSLLSTSPMCMQSTISDLINPEGKRMRTEELDALLNSQKKTRGDGDLLSLVSDGDRITSTPQRLEDTLPLDLKLTPSVDKSKSRSLLGAGNLDTFDPSLSGLAALFPSTIHAPAMGRRPELRHSEFVSHITAAVELLNPPEQDRLKSILRQPTVQGAMETLLSICSSNASDTSDFIASQPQQMHHRDQMMLGNVMPLRMESLAPQGPSDTFTNVLHTYGSSRVSPRVMGAGPGGFTPRDGDSMSGHPSSQHGCPMGQPGNPEYGSALLDQLQEAQRAARKRAGYADDGPLGCRLASPRRRKTGPPSSRDKVWDLLTMQEKKQTLADQMSAAEGTKILLERRAAQLGCDIVEMTDEDDWDIGFKLTECKATSEPLSKPKNCSICLRNGVVFHRHSYYCRRCAQLYRAIHRKKTTLQNEGHAGSQ